jgi:hypothetical protein
MKKTLYTLSFLALFTIAANAQTHEKKIAQEQQTTKINDDGTISTISATESVDKVEKIEKKEEPKPKTATRMAINQKGAPTSKTKTSKEETKKAESPGQPAINERKE